MGTTPRVGGAPGRRDTAGARLRACKRASVAATHATEHIHASARIDPAAAADAVWAAADLLHAAAHLVDGPDVGPLTDAAETYDRAARELHARRPTRSTPGHELRRAARLLLDTGLHASLHRTNPHLAALLAQLTQLAHTVSQLRAAQNRLHQARAARHAADHLAEMHSARSGSDAPPPAAPGARTPTPTARPATVSSSSRTTHRLGPTTGSPGRSRAP